MDLAEKAPAVEYGQPPCDVELRSRDSPKRPGWGKAIAVTGLTVLALWLLCSSWQGSDDFEMVHMAHSSRNRRVDSGSQSVDGDFELLDSLSISSRSGSINVGVYPQPVDEENPAPAELSIRSSSGSVNVNLQALNAPERDYRVSVESGSGSVDGHILHGQKTSVTSGPGSVKMQITPYAADDYASSLRVSSTSGMQEVSLLSPVKGTDTSISRMASVHSTQSGSLVLHYPREWEGTIEGHTGSGSLCLRAAHGLEIIRQGSTGASGHYVLARKGKGNSTLNFHTGSGSVDVYFS